MRLLFTLLMAVALLVPAATAAAAGDAEAQVEWVKEHALPFDTQEAGYGFDDLAPLKEIIRDARIVGLGEVTHGTREHFQMKHRLVEFLATEMGFTIFSIEASTPEAYKLNDYVLGGEGDPNALVAGMYFWTWNTEEVLAMVEWMREFNASGKGPVQFTGFDMQTPDVAAGIVVDFLARVDAGQAGVVRARYDAVMSVRQADGGFGVATMSFPVEAAKGKHLKYSGYIKTENVVGGWAGLWWRADVEDGNPAFDNMAGRGPTGTTDWNRFTIELDIPENTANINFGVILPGAGRAWFDKLTVELDGEVYDTAEEFDFGFEADAIAGYYASNDGNYRATLDDGERYSGKQSLCLEKIEDENPGSPAADEAAATAGELLAAIVRSRDEYAKTAADEEIEWAIHNARIVEQCMLSRADRTYMRRDRFMAENVEWIAGQNPGAKIILWAHNGHVARFHSKMGWYLDETYGEGYLPVGFTAAQGRYQAMGDGGLGNHDLAPPPAQSVERILAATGEPRLILDLRSADDGSGGGWLAEPVKMRSIGAMAMEPEQQFFFFVIPDAFDVLVYFEQTTAAIPIGGLE